MKGSTPVTLMEILSQTEAWAEAINVVAQHQSDLNRFILSHYNQVVFIGCGSTYYLSLSASTLMQSLTGTICRGIPSSELMFSNPQINSEGVLKTLLFVISRSGATTETIRATQKFRDCGCGDIITVTNYNDSPLSKLGDVNIVIPSGREKSVAQTRSFASMYVATTAMACFFSKRSDLTITLDGLVSIGTRMMHDYDETARQFGEDHNFSQFFFLGSGRNYGLACEASLKLKEMSISVSEPFHFLEFRHGPKSMVNPNTLVVGLLSEEWYEHEVAVLNEVGLLGGKILTLGERNADINFISGLPEVVQGVLYLPILQLMASYRATSFGLNPDSPRNLTSVVELQMP
jgi:glutamine---fructose-6-phosphate transaminase (isomerizing)